MAQRRTNKEIAETLHLSEGTVKQYINQLYAKLDIGGAVRNKRAQLALLLWNTAGRPEPAALPAFADVTDPDTAKAAQWCMEAGFFQPREDGNFKPGKHVSRWKVLRTYQRIVK